MAIGGTGVGIEEAPVMLWVETGSLSMARSNNKDIDGNMIPLQADLDNKWSMARH
jgi:hypothetical protein